MIGINLTGVEYWSGVRAFSNLMAGGGWQLVTATGSWVSMPADKLDANKNPTNLGPGEQVARFFCPPTAAYRGKSVEMVCRWEGKATVWINGEVVKNLVVGNNSATFTFVPKGQLSGHLLIRNIDPTNPIRNIDCREKDADPDSLFDPVYLDELRLYSGIRFLKWMRSAESNIPVSWATRTKPGDGVINGSDSIPVEYMVQLANTLKADPWFTLSLNADADYVKKFATYVRDNLDSSLKAYVENSNEVWNSVYPATWQARDEGIALKLAPSNDPNTNTLRRYAQRTTEFMKIWTDVYAGKSNRLVRVAASQHSPYNAGVILGFSDTSKYLDAFATAPYFNATVTPAVDVEAVFRTFPPAITSLIDNAVAIKGIANRYGLDYISYEGGQHFLGDVPKITAINKDPRMGDLYKQYLTEWTTKIGTRLTLYADIGGPSSYGYWGQRDYTGQPLSEAVKAKAVEEFLTPVVPQPTSNIPEYLNEIEALLQLIREELNLD